MKNKLQPLLCRINPKDKREMHDILEYCSSIPIVGFNSGGYDINILKDYGFINELLKRDNNPFIIKNGNRYKAIKTKQFLFRIQNIYHLLIQNHIR